MNIENDVFVVPGEKIATEEEFAAGHNTYVENGLIYSSVIGKVMKTEGSIDVSCSGREIKIIDRDMLIVGVVTDDMKNVTFVRIDDINVEGKDYLALKDGKIIAPKPRMGGGHFDRNGGGNRFSSPKPEKMCGIGDTILARVQYNDKDSYTLALNGPEMGVIFAKCEKCSGELEIKGERLLVCKDCTHKENRKISTLYNKPKEIKKLLILT